jgi:hypothetical protein
MRRFVGLVVLGAMFSALLAVQGSTLASGEEDEHPVGYTVGFDARGDGQICHFYKVDLTTGDATRVSSSPVHCADGLTFDDDETLYAYRNSTTTGKAPFAELITIDLDDGAQHVVGSLPRVLVGDAGMTFDEDGRLWLYGFTFDDPPCPTGRYCLWRVDPEDASTTFVGAAPIGRGVFGLTGDCEDVIAITAQPADGPVGPQVRLDEVNTSNAALELITDLPGFGFPTGLDFEDDGDLWALANTGLGAGAGIGMAVYRIDPSDGTFQTKDITVNGAPFGGIMDGLAVDPISCEDPTPPTPPTPAPTPVAVAPVFTG